MTGSLSAGAIVGVIVGTLLGALALTTLSFFWARNRRRNARPVKAVRPTSVALSQTGSTSSSYSQDEKKAAANDDEGDVYEVAPQSPLAQDLEMGTTVPVLTIQAPQSTVSLVSNATHATEATTVGTATVAAPCASETVQIYVNPALRSSFMTNPSSLSLQTVQSEAAQVLTAHRSETGLPAAARMYLNPEEDAHVARMPEGMASSNSLGLYSISLNDSTDTVTRADGLPGYAESVSTMTRG